MADINTFWNWSGQYVGYRSFDGLFGCDGNQIGYFAEGDEVYACDGRYIGEVRNHNRVITNLSKKVWTRESLTPRILKSSTKHRDINAKEMLAGFEDFWVPPANIWFK